MKHNLYSATDRVDSPYSSHLNQEGYGLGNMVGAAASLGGTPGVMDNLGRLINELSEINKRSLELAERIGGASDPECGPDCAENEPANLAGMTRTLLRIAGDTNARLSRCLRNL